MISSLHDLDDLSDLDLMILKIGSFNVTYSCGKTQLYF